MLRLVGSRRGGGGRWVLEVDLRPLLGRGLRVGAVNDDAERGEALHEGRLGGVVLRGRDALGVEELLEEEELVAEHGGLLRVLRRRRRDERGEHGAAEGGDVGGRDDALAVERGEVEDAVEGLLLPLELLRVAARGGLVGGEAAPDAEGGDDGLAQGRDGVLQARVVRRRVRVPHGRGARCRRRRRFLAISREVS